MIHAASTTTKVQTGLHSQDEKPCTNVLLTAMLRELSLPDPYLIL
jgi:hypothetical protein